MGSSWQDWAYLLAMLSTDIVPSPVPRVGILCAYGVLFPECQIYTTNCLPGIFNNIPNLAWLKWNSWIPLATCSFYCLPCLGIPRYCQIHSVLHAKNLVLTTSPLSLNVSIQFIIKPLSVLPLIHVSKLPCHFILPPIILVQETWSLSWTRAIVS